MISNYHNKCIRGIPFK